MELQHTSEEYSNVLRKGFYFLRFCNLLILDENQSRFRRVFPLVYKVPCMVLMFVSLSAYFGTLAQRADILVEDLAASVSVYIVSLQVLYRIIILVRKTKEIRALTRRLGDLWMAMDLSEEQETRKKKLLDRLNLQYKMAFFVIMYGSCQYLLLPLIETLVRRFVLKQDSKLLFPMASVYPFDPAKDWARYLVIYTLQAYALQHLVNIYFGSELIIMALTSHLGTLFGLLQYEIENLDPDNSLMSDCSTNTERNKSQSIRSLIRRHQQLLELANDLDNIFNGIVFINLSASTLMITFFLFTALVAKQKSVRIMNFMAAISTTFPMYCVCYYGELLKEASQEIGDAAFRSSWYKGTQNYKQAIMFTIMRSQNPCYLTSLKYSKISLQTFMSVLSTTWSYFSLALNMYEGN